MVSIAEQRYLATGSARRPDVPRSSVTYGVTGGPGTTARQTQVSIPSSISSISQKPSYVGMTPTDYNRVLTQWKTTQIPRVTTPTSTITQNISPTKTWISRDKLRFGQPVYRNEYGKIVPQTNTEKINVARKEARILEKTYNLPGTTVLELKNSNNSQNKVSPYLSLNTNFDKNYSEKVGSSMMSGTPRKNDFFKKILGFF